MAIETKNYPAFLPLPKNGRLGNKAPLYNIEERILRHNPKLIGSIPRRQISYLLRRLLHHPQLRSIYVKNINIIILDEVLFKSFILFNPSKKKEE